MDTSDIHRKLAEIRTIIETNNERRPNITSDQDFKRTSPDPRERIQIIQKVKLLNSENILGMTLIDKFTQEINRRYDLNMKMRY